MKVVRNIGNSGTMQKHEKWFKAKQENKKQMEAEKMTKKKKIESQ